MDNSLVAILGAVIGVAVAVVLGRRKIAGTGRQSPGRIALIVLAAAGAAAIGAFAASFVLSRVGGDGAVSRQATIERAMAEIKATPLIGLVAAEHPEVDQQFRRAIEAEMQSPDNNRRTFEAGAAARQRYVLPALRAADDATALRAVKAMETFALYLQKKDVATCRAFGLEGIRNPAALDREGGRLFRDVMAAQEDAYRSGKGKTPATPPLTDQEGARLLIAGGVSPADFDALQKADRLPPAEMCAITVKLYAAPSIVPASEGGKLARYLLAVPQ